MMRHPAVLFVALLCWGFLFSAAASPASAEAAGSAFVRGERPLLIERIRPERPHWDNHYGGDRRRPAWDQRRDRRHHARPPYGYAPPPPPRRITARPTATASPPGCPAIPSAMIRAIPGPIIPSAMIRAVARPGMIRPIRTIRTTMTVTMTAADRAATAAAGFERAEAAGRPPCGKGGARIPLFCCPGDECARLVAHPESGDAGEDREGQRSARSAARAATTAASAGRKGREGASDGRIQRRLWPSRLRGSPSKAVTWKKCRRT